MAIMATMRWSPGAFCFLAGLVVAAGLTLGCGGKQVPSYKDRLGTIDPATAPIDTPPPPPPR